jgi:hypothetical protein
MKSIFALQMVAIAALVSITSPAAFADVTTTVQFPVGEWLGSASTFLVSLAGVAFVWFCRFLPGYAVAMMKTFGVEQMLKNAVLKAINSVAGANHDTTLSVDVGNKVAAEALQYVTKHAPGWMMDHVGGWDLLREKIIARLKLEPAAVVVNGQIEKGSLPKPIATKK